MNKMARCKPKLMNFINTLNFSLRYKNSCSRSTILFVCFQVPSHHSSELFYHNRRVTIWKLALQEKRLYARTLTVHDVTHVLADDQGRKEIVIQALFGKYFRKYGVDNEKNNFSKTNLIRIGKAMFCCGCDSKYYFIQNSPKIKKEATFIHFLMYHCSKPEHCPGKDGG